MKNKNIVLTKQCSKLIIYFSFLVWKSYSRPRFLQSRENRKFYEIGSTSPFPVDDVIARNRRLFVFILLKTNKNDQIKVQIRLLIHQDSKKDALKLSLKMQIQNLKIIYNLVMWFLEIDQYNNFKIVDLKLSVYWWWLGFKPLSIRKQILKFKVKIITKKL